MADRPRVALHHAVRDCAVAWSDPVARGDAGRATISAARIAAGEVAAGLALETTPADALSRAGRRVDDVKAAATRPCGSVHATAAPEATAAVKTTRGMHAATAVETASAAVETAAATMEAATTAAVKAATSSAMEAAASTATRTAATTAMRACRVGCACEQKPCDSAREDRDERQRNRLAASSSQHVFLQLIRRRSGRSAAPGIL